MFMNPGAFFKEFGLCLVLSAVAFALVLGVAALFDLPLVPPPNLPKPGDHVYLISEGKIAQHHRLPKGDRVQLRGGALLSGPSGKVISFTTVEGEYIEWNGFYQVTTKPLDAKVGDPFSSERKGQ